MTVTNDEFALAATDGNHRVDGGDARLHGLVHRLALDDARRGVFDQARIRGGNVTLAVDGQTQRIDHTAEHGFTNRHRRDLAGGLDGAALLDAIALTHQHDTNVVVFQVQSKTFSAVFEHHQLAGHDVVKAVDAGDAVTHLQHGADIADRNGLVIVLDLLLEDGADLVGTNGNHGGKEVKGGRGEGEG